jgi:hypothetical protein
MLERWEGEFASFEAQDFAIDTNCVDTQVAAYRALGCTSEPASRKQAAALTAVADLAYCHAVTQGLPEGADCKFVDTLRVSKR